MNNKLFIRKKNFFVKFYNDSNLGDDLFLEGLLRRFPQHNFTIYDDQKSPQLNITLRQYDNLHLSNTCLSYKSSYKDILQYDGYVLIGGSVFQDRSARGYRHQIARYLTFRKIFKLGRPVFVLGSNLGPFNTLFGKSIIRRSFKYVTHSCVRDHYSLKLLKKWGYRDIDYAPDIVFGYDYQVTSNLHRNPNILGISVINTKLNPESRQSYINKISELANAYLLISTVKLVRIYGFDGGRENDGYAIDQVMSLINYPERTTKVVYSEKTVISTYLESFYECHFMVTSRFHSMVLAAKFGIPFFPITYSSKTSDVLKDLGYHHEQIQYEKINELNTSKLIKRIISGSLPFPIPTSIFNESTKHFLGLERHV